MATPRDQDQERSKPPLHNFSLPYLKWGNQRLLRCVKLTHNDNNDDTQINNDIPRTQQNQNRNQNQNPGSPSNNLRFNNGTSLVLAAASAAKVSPFLEQETDNNKGGNVNVNVNDDASRPWNLRTRRAACKAPLRIQNNNNNNTNTNNNNNNIDSLRRNLEIVSSPNNNNNNTCCIVNKKVKFSVPLLKEEIEHDFFQIARIRPPRRPKKRPRIVQKYLDSIFPGLWLSEVTPDSYRVPDVPES